MTSQKLTEIGLPPGKEKRQLKGPEMPRKGEMLRGTRAECHSMGKGQKMLIKGQVPNPPSANGGPADGGQPKGGREALRVVAGRP